MNIEGLNKVARAMVAPGRGILAMDESHPTCNKRFEKLGIPTTEPMRQAYRDMLVTAHGLSDYVSGAILFDETIRQKTLDGTPFADYLTNKGIIPGIKVDAGAKPLAGYEDEKVTHGLDGLRERCVEYFKLGARFSKWRAVITIGEGFPSWSCIEANAHALARYARISQEAGLVPIVEPEVLMDGDHSIECCYKVTELTQRVVFYQLKNQGVVLRYGSQAQHGHFWCICQLPRRRENCCGADCSLPAKHCACGSARHCFSVWRANRPGS